MSGLAQLTIEGAEVPHHEVVKGPSDSRVLRRPRNDDPALPFVDALNRALDRAQIAPGDAFYVSRLPKLPPASPGQEPKPSKCPQSLPRWDSQRGRVLRHLVARHPAGVLRADVLEWAVVEGLPLASVNRRLQELREAGLVRIGTSSGKVYLTNRCVDLVREAGGAARRPRAHESDPA